MGESSCPLTLDPGICGGAGDRGKDLSPNTFREKVTQPNYERLTMETEMIKGEPWHVHGKEIVPLLREIRVGPRKAGKGGGEFAFRWLRPAGFIVRQEGREDKVNLPLATYSGPIMLAACTGLFVLLFIVRLLAGRPRG